MNEQKIYQKILGEIIDQANNDQILTTRQLLDLLSYELVKHKETMTTFMQKQDKILN